MGKTPCTMMGTRHMLLSDVKNLNTSTPNMKPNDIYQQNSTTNKCRFLKTKYFNNCFH